MTGGNSTAEDWLKAYTKAVEQLAVDSMQVELNGGLVRDDAMPTGMTGSLIALISEDVSVQIGFFASQEGCEQFTRQLLMMEPDEEDPNAEDIADALGEIVNITAGVVKTAMNETHPSITLGLPICLCGKIQTTDQMEVAAGRISLGDETAQLVVIRSAK